MATTMRGFGAQNVMSLMQSESTPDSLVAMLASCNSMGLQVPHSVGGLEDAVVGCGQKRPFYPSFVDGSLGGEEAGVDDDGVDDCSPSVEKKRRLTFDQVRSLERNFELENKLEPERKMQLAKELGLQPRQVAVWFQNRRARWKTKQLERDYEVLSLDYNRMKAEYETIVLEKEKLKTEIQELSGKTQAEFRGCVDAHVDTNQSRLSPGGPRAAADSVSVKAEMTSELVTQQTTSEPAAAQWKQEQQPSSTPITVDIISSSKSKESKEQSTTSSGSNNSSEILDTDSPRAIDNYRLSLCNQATVTQEKEDDEEEQQQQLQQGLANCSQFISESFVGDPSLLHVVADDLCCSAAGGGGRICSPAQMFQRVAIKLEADGSSNSCYQDDQSCNYFLSQMDDKAAMPWWDWA
ncbi:unnamed protein product [Sphagnum balticum]